MKKFSSLDLKLLWKPDDLSSGEDNGQVTIVGGSSLFQGAPLMALTSASRIVDMVFLATPGEDKTIVNKAKLFSKLRSVIWVPKEDIDAYIEKSDAALVGPGMMRFKRETDRRPGDGEVLDQEGTETKMMTKYLLGKHPNAKWVIDGGSLQTMDAEWIPRGAIVTPNKREFEILFGRKCDVETAQEMAKQYRCVVVVKGPIAYVTDGVITYEINGGNAGLTKGGTGDVLAGVIVGLLAKNDPVLAAATGAYLVKKTAERLFDRVGLGFNADDLALAVFETWRSQVGL